MAVGGLGSDTRDKEVRRQRIGGIVEFLVV
jgi:hypothetical protein